MEFLKNTFYKIIGSKNTHRIRKIYFLGKYGINIDNAFDVIKLVQITSKDYYNKKYKTDVEIGDFTYGTPAINAGGEGPKLKIGKYCSIGSEVVIMLGGEHHVDWITTYPFKSMLHNFKYIEGTREDSRIKGDVIIGNDVWIGSNAKIMSGVSIGDGCVIGANALVTKNMPDYSICVGVPAKVIKKRFECEIIEKLKIMAWWNWPIENICKIIPVLQSNKINDLIRYY